MQMLSNKIKKNNFLIFFSFLLIAGFFIFSFQTNAASGPYDYTQLEPIPGSSATTGADLKTYIESIYKFAIWTVGIAAILMITIGGFMYLTSAGNTSKMDDAKKVVTDALIGLAIVLTAYLVLYVINPDLVKVTLSLKALKSGMSSTIMSGGTSLSSGGGTGKCEALTTGPCSPDNLKSACSWDAEKASAICNKESAGKESAASTVDICRDGNVFSYGLFQINLTCQCKNVFTPVKEKGCVNKACSVSDNSGYQSCVSTYKTISSNISKACQI